MLETLVKQGVIFYVMGIVFVFAVIAKLISYVTVRKMVKAASEIHKSNHKLMRLIRAKFEHASMVSDRVQNVEAFVKKYIYEYKVLGIRNCSWRSSPKRMMYVVVLLGALGVLTGYRLEGAGVLMLKYLQWTSIFGLLWSVLYFVLEEKTKVDAAKNYIVEYLENVCVHRYQKVTEASKEEMKVSQEEPIQEELKIQLKEEPSQKQKNDQEIRIRAILEEFLA